MNTKKTLTIFVALAIVCAPSGQLACAQDASNSWVGRWQSDANQHSGTIGATFCQTGPRTMRANFRGTFAKIIPFRYRTQLNIVSKQPGLTVMAGNRRLPLGGQFSYSITMTEQCFHGTFSSRRNRGTFVMQRQ